jgi:hypothetical protein
MASVIEDRLADVAAHAQGIPGEPSVAQVQELTLLTRDAAAASADADQIAAAAGLSVGWVRTVRDEESDHCGTGRESRSGWCDQTTGEGVQVM